MRHIEQEKLDVGFEPAKPQAPVPPLPPPLPMGTSKRRDAPPTDEQVETLFKIINDLDSTTQNGAAWEEVIKICEKQKISEDTAEEAINRLLDQGKIYEPVLGRLKMA